MRKYRELLPVCVGSLLGYVFVNIMEATKKK